MPGFETIQYRIKRLSAFQQLLLHQLYPLSLSLFPEMSVKVGSEVRNAVDGWVMVNGTLRKITDIWVMVNGTLKKVKISENN